MAAAAFQRSTARLLVRKGAALDARNRRGAEPLHYAADANVWNPTAQAGVITYLLSAAASVNARDANGATPLHRAVRTRSAPAVRALLAGGADVHATNKNGSRPFDLAVHNTGRGGSGSTRARAATGGHHHDVDRRWRQAAHEDRCETPPLATHTTRCRVDRRASAARNSDCAACARSQHRDAGCVRPSMLLRPRRAGRAAGTADELLDRASRDAEVLRGQRRFLAAAAHLHVEIGAAEPRGRSPTGRACRPRRCAGDTNSAPRRPLREARRTVALESRARQPCAPAPARRRLAAMPLPFWPRLIVVPAR